jgi:hypothetical protein
VAARADQRRLTGLTAQGEIESNDSHRRARGAVSIDDAEPAFLLRKGELTSELPRPGDHPRRRAAHGRRLGEDLARLAEPLGGGRYVGHAHHLQKPSRASRSAAGLRAQPVRTIAARAFEEINV